MKAQSRQLLWVALFAVAMAYAESAVVVYLRRIYGIGADILTAPSFDPQIGAIEAGRELATLVMLLSVGWLAGKTFRSRLGFAIFAFGVWDIFYYIWLRVFIGWPVTPFDTDLLFLLPLPWWGPVLAPMLVALLMAIAGARLALGETSGYELRPTLAEWGLLALGVLIILYAFMADAIAALPADIHTLGLVRLSVFNWPVFLLGLGLAAVFVWRAFKPARTAPIQGG
jgi:hypothetical protein